MVLVRAPGLRGLPAALRPEHAPAQALVIEPNRVGALYEISANFSLNDCAWSRGGRKYGQHLGLSDVALNVCGGEGG